MSILNALVGFIYPSEAFLFIGLCIVAIMSFAIFICGIQHGELYFIIL